MPRIAVLPSAVADQIAAGEVVERPASVVKELLENALDAGARAVDVAVEDGGRSLVRVSDDGYGMDRSDALLALERHATSKIRAAADLVGVPTFGFRGEALPAIASVSHLELVTAVRDGAATSVRAAGGVVVDVRDEARRRGTTVSVRQLFYNVPARQRFLRTPRSEWRAVADAVIVVALSRLDVRIALTHDGAATLTLPPAAALRDRVGALWGPALAGRFVDVDAVRGPIRVAGLVERPGDVGTSSRRVSLVVNGRAVRDAGLVRAAEAAYRSTLGAGLRPSLLLELTVPAADVDVNVHPAKAEVRFRERWETERAVEHAVRRALGTPESAARFEPRPTIVWGTGREPVPVDVEILRPGRTGDAAAGPLFALADSPVDTALPLDGQVAHAPPAAGPGALPLFQLRRTYIVCEHAGGAVFVDQHSAHERVLYERFMHALRAGRLASQRLLFPATVELSPAQHDALEAHRETFDALGYELAAFGGPALVVTAVPAPHPRFDALRCLTESLDALTGDRASVAASRHEHLVATVACKAAIKAGDTLSQEEMRALLAALAETSLPAHDVHGRATIVRLPWDEIERRFGRR